MARRRRSNLKGWISLAAAIGLVGAGAGVWAYSQPLPRDEQSLCLKGDGSTVAFAEPAHHILIVDKTDKWNSAQESRLRNIVTGMRDQLGLNERLTIFVFSDTVQPGFLPVFSLCNPGRASNTNIWTSNPRRWEKKFVESFGRPLDAIMAELTQATEGPVSPILEVLIDLSNREELVAGDTRRRIVLVSDMLQNSAIYTFFPKPPAPPPVVRPLPPPPPNIGGPLVEPLPINPGSPKSGLTQRPITLPAPKPRPPEPRKLSAKDATEMVDRKGGLRHLRKFKIEVYQVRGVYPDEKLTAARQFWDLIAGQYGVTIEWKVL